MADFDSSDYLSYTGNTQYDPTSDTSEDYGDTGSGSFSFENLLKGIGNVLGGTSDAGKWGQLGAFLGLSGLANRSSYFNAPTTRVGYQGTIPAYSYSRQQTPVAQQRPAGYRPGQGGISYFTPGYYKDLGVEPKKGQEFLAAMAAMLPPGTIPAAETTPAETTTNQMARGGYAFGGLSSREGAATYEDGGGFGGEYDYGYGAAEPFNFSRTAGDSTPTTIDMSSPAAVVDTGDMFKKQALSAPANTSSGIATLPAVTSQQIFDIGKGLLQQGLDPQTLLNKLASQTAATQEQIGEAAGWLGASGYTGLDVPGSKSTVMPVTSRAAADVGAPPVIPAPPSDYTNDYTQYENQQNANRAREIIDSGMSTFANKTNITTQDILETGRSLLQQGVNPQDVLNQLAKNPSVTQATLNSAAAALGASGYSNLLTPMTKFTSQASGALTGGSAGAVTGGGATNTGGISTLQTDDKKTTMPVQTRAEADAGITSLPAAALSNQLLSAFTQGQQTGNYGNFQSLLRQGKISASDLAAMFPQLSEQNVLDFARQHNLSLSKPERANLAAVMRDPRAESASSLNLAKQLVTSMGPGYENLLSDPKLLQQMREASPTDYQQILLGGFNAAQRTGDFAKFNKMLADRDISETELRTLFPNITNAAIDEFKKRGLKFNARPDWLENQNTIKDQSVAEQVADKWKQEYGRDISPDELKTISYQIGNMPSQADAKTVIGNIKNTPLTKSQEFLDAQKRGETFVPSMLTLQKAGLLDLVGGYEGGLPARYDWAAIANSKDPRGAIIASNRQLAAMADRTLAKDYPQYATIVGTVSGIPLIQRITQKGDTYLTLGGASITDSKSLSKVVYQLGLTSDDLNKFADLADKSGTSYKPGTVYAGSDAGVDLRDIAAGGLGTKYNPFNDPYVATKGTGAVERQNDFQYYAGQLGLARNPNITSKSGYEIPSASDIRPIYDREGKIQNYAVISGGGVRYFSSPAEAASQGYKNVINLTGRSPTVAYGQQTYRPGEKIIAPTLPNITLRKLPGGAAGGLGSIIRGKRGYAMGGGIEMLAKGRYLKGNGDGVSDSIPARFAGSGQPAALADGEFVVPARVVSELGNGSSDAGARKLYAMLDRVEQRARKAKRGKPSGADRELKKLA